MLYIGIDTGTHTGLAIWDSGREQFLALETMPLHKALFVVEDYLLNEKDGSGDEVTVVFEDARQRKYLPQEHNISEYRGRLMGAGSVKRDAVIWEEYLTDRKARFLKVAPKKGMTKWSEEAFAMATGWTKRTSNHARDAAMLVWGRR